MRKQKIERTGETVTYIDVTIKVYSPKIQAIGFEIVQPPLPANPDCNVRQELLNQARAWANGVCGEEFQAAIDLHWFLENVDVDADGNETWEFGT